MLYFAFGSNMDLKQMLERCSTARCFCKARLEDQRLVFARKSGKWGCGVASVERSDGSEVWGVVYQIDESEIGALDRNEGYDPNRPAQKNSYVRKEMRVFRDGDERHPLTVWTYVANEPKSPAPPPSAKYVQAIVQGARHWRLPTDYIANLERIETKG